jgi:ClpP class serine protease
MFIYDINRSINDYTADQIYNALKASDHNKDVLLIIFSNGGSIEPAYLISKCCRKYSNRFIVAIPRRAKSAATLIALGANEIHMGAMSQLGPLDPQMLSGLPTLGLRDGIKQLLSLCSDYPIAADMIAKYLDYKLELNTLG